MKRETFQVQDRRETQGTVDIEQGPSSAIKGQMMFLDERRPEQMLSFIKYEAESGALPQSYSIQMSSRSGQFLIPIACAATGSDVGRILS